jgi:outer membrane protein TolC
LQDYAALDINAEIIRRAEYLAKTTNDAAKTGLIKNTADTNRAQTELNLRREERITLEAQAAAVSAHLAQLLLLEPTVDLRPADAVVMPIALVPAELPLGEMVAIAFLNRPELSSNRALVEAAVERWRQARYSPLIPKIDLAYYAGDFGGGRNSVLSNFDSRGDGLAQAVWQLQNLGFGDVANARLRESQVNQAMLHVQEVQAQVGAEVSAAAKQVQARQRALASAAEAVVQAEEMWRKLKEQAMGLTARENLVDAIQPVLALQALAQARAQYLTQVIEYNRAQFRLYVAMGQPALESLPHATSLPLNVPVLPKESPEKKK